MYQVERIERAMSVACRFVVSKVAIEPNVRGVLMRRVELRAVDGEAFQPTHDGDGVESAVPDGAIRLLVNATFAKAFALGDEFTVSFRERE
jgi:hypothetical protein